MRSDDVPWMFSGGLNDALMDWDMWSDLQRRTAVDKWVNLRSSFLSGHEGAARKRLIHIFPIHKHGYRPKKITWSYVISKTRVSYSLCRWREPRRTNVQILLLDTIAAWLQQWRARGIHLTHTRFQLVFRPLASQLHDPGESAGSHAQTFRAAGAVATLWHAVSDEDAMCTFTTSRALQSIVQEGN